MSLSIKDNDALNSFVASGDTHLKKGQYREAIDKYSKALEINEESQTVLLSRAQAYLCFGDPSSAIDDAETTMKEDPTFWKGILIKAEALFQRGDFEMALVFFHRGLRLRNVEQFRLGIQKSEQAIFDCINRGGDNVQLPSLRHPSVPRIEGRIDITTARSLAGQLTDIDFGDHGETPDFTEQNSIVIPPPPSMYSKTLETPRAKVGSRPSRRSSSRRYSIPSHEKSIGPITSSIPKTANKRLLGSLYDDKKFLEELKNDPLLKRSNIQMSTTRGKHSRSLDSIIEDGLAFLDHRLSFYREQKPPGSTRSIHSMSQKNTTTSIEVGKTPLFSPRMQTDRSHYVKGASKLKNKTSSKSGAQTSRSSSRMDTQNEEVDWKILLEEYETDIFNGKPRVQECRNLLSKLVRASNLPDKAKYVSRLYILVGVSFDLLEVYPSAIKYYEYSAKSANRAQLVWEEFLAVKHLGDIHARLNRLQRALLNYNKCVSLYHKNTSRDDVDFQIPEIYEIHYLEAETLFNLKDYDKARKSFLDCLSSFDNGLKIENIVDFEVDDGRKIKFLEILSLGAKILTKNGETHEAVNLYTKFAGIAGIDLENQQHQKTNTPVELIVSTLESFGSTLLQTGDVLRSMKLNETARTYELIINNQDFVDIPENDDDMVENQDQNVEEVETINQDNLNKTNEKSNESSDVVENKEISDDENSIKSVESEPEFTSSPQ
eukprot:TRINITY_DN3529_c0_g1_i1.p1 TRINITY_DN3529_c0_g1~~TRINITY_DN3529_c0_g1_i1.p1  ORF type:complete len:716 (+),score=218.74 TRINITY_DN3529_c0_g1_i1:36-2183(+)